MRYVVVVNMPGYLPMDDEPPVFDTLVDAREYAYDECLRIIEDSHEYADAYGDIYRYSGGPDLFRLTRENGPAPELVVHVLEYEDDE